MAAIASETVHHRRTAATDRFDRLWRSLAASNHELTVFCPGWSGSDRDITAMHLDGIHRVVTDDVGITYRWLIDDPELGRRFHTRLPRAIRGADVDIIHAVDTPGAVLAGRAGSAIARVPLLAEWYTPPSPGFAARRAVRAPARTIVPSELVHRQLRERGVTADSITVVPTAIDFETVEAIPPTEGPEIVFAGQLDKSANVDSLLLGLAELRDRDWSAGIIGDGPAKDTYQQQAADLRIDDRVSFLGELAVDDRLALYRNAHVFVHTAEQSPFAHELLLGLACGCVGIAEYHTDSSAHELLVGRDRGFRITSPQELADAIVAAGSHTHRDIDPAFSEYDRHSIRKRYLEQYRLLIE